MGRLTDPLLQAPERTRQIFGSHSVQLGAMSPAQGEPRARPATTSQRSYSSCQGAAIWSSPGIDEPRKGQRWQILIPRRELRAMLAQRGCCGHGNKTKTVGYRLGTQQVEQTACTCSVSRIDCSDATRLDSPCIQPMADKSLFCASAV